jgi:hypothetical protein
MKRRVVLYNPHADYYTMPLALVAIASHLDPERYETVIVDSRLETDPTAALVRAAEGAVCVGVTVLTGAPIRDAVGASRAVKARYPSLPVVWGGWHPSMFGAGWAPAAQMGGFAGLSGGNVAPFETATRPAQRFTTSLSLIF